MKIGFAGHDITPRIGVELCGFGPFRCRHSNKILHPLWAKAMVIEQGSVRAAIISCDLIGITLALTNQIRSLVTKATGIPKDAILVHCTHTHSGPNTGGYIGWGEPDQPYLETLPQRIALAVQKATENMVEATLSHAEVPCEGMAINREYEGPAPPLPAGLNPDWRPEKPDLTDTTCHVIEARSGEKRLGFLAFFSCHPVVCCEKTHAIHGDYCGVAMRMLEDEYPGAVGLFLQGALGDVNPCVAHESETDSFSALDQIAARFADSVRVGLQKAQAFGVNEIRFARRDVVFSRKPWGPEELRRRLAAVEQKLNMLEATDIFFKNDVNIRMETVYAIALRRLIAQAERGESLSPTTEIQGLRLGPLSLLATPLEIFQSIKNEVHKQVKSPIPFIMSVTNDTAGYATDYEMGALGGYAAEMVPLITGSIPYAQIYDEIVQELLALDAELH